VNHSLALAIENKAIRMKLGDTMRLARFGLPNVNVSIGNLDAKRFHQGSVFRLHLARQLRVNPTLAPPANGFNQGNPVNPRDIVLVGKVIETRHVKQGLLLHCCCSKVRELKLALPHSFYDLLSPYRQPIPADSARILQTRVDSCRNTRNTLFFAGKRKSRALAEEPRKPRNEPRVNRVSAPLVRNPSGKFGPALLRRFAGAPCSRRVDRRQTMLAEPDADISPDRAFVTWQRRKRRCC
jgi:hypothetical protein